MIEFEIVCFTGVGAVAEGSTNDAHVFILARGTVIVCVASDILMFIAISQWRALARARRTVGICVAGDPRSPDRIAALALRGAHRFVIF